MGIAHSRSTGPLPDISVDPTALATPGLIILGITALVVNLSDADIVLEATGILVPLTFCGGLGQLLVAARDWSRKNVFSATVFASYGLFWLSFIPLVILPRAGQAAPQSQALAAHLAIWGIFTIVLFKAFSRKSRSMRLMFGLLASFLLLSAAGAATQNMLMQTIAGYAGGLFGIDAVLTGIFRNRSPKE